MKYGKIVEGKFIDRPNRFIAHVEIAGKAETVHVKNTGRCRELLLPGAAVRLEQSDNPARKTLYDLVAVYKDRIGWINIDSQAPNKVVKEWLEAQDYDVVRPEYTYGNSRIDFYLEKGEHKILMEVKGCTLEINGIGYFPDAPTERGVKHLRELAAARQEGYECVVAFVIQMEGVTEVRPYVEMQPEFGTALAEAEAAGVKVLFLPCRVGRDWLKIDGKLVKKCYQIPVVSGIAAISSAIPATGKPPADIGDNLPARQFDAVKIQCTGQFKLDDIIAFGLFLFDVPQLARKGLIRIGGRITIREVFCIQIFTQRRMAEQFRTDQIVEINAQGGNGTIHITQSKNRCGLLCFPRSGKPFRLNRPG